MKRLAQLFPFLASGLLLASCRSMVETVVRPDGSGELRSAVVFSASELEGFSQAEGNAGNSICDDLRAQAPAGATFVEEERKGETYCTTVHIFASLAQLRELYRDLPNVTVHTAKIDLGRFQYDVEVRANEPSGQGEASPLEWRVVVPGTLVTTDATSVQGSTLVWQIDPGETRTLHAETSLGLSLSTLGATGVAIVAFVLALAGGGALLLTRRRS